LFVKPPSPFLAHTWTIGAEEQLYLIWPWILQRCGKYLSVVLYLFIGLALLSCWSYEYWFPYHAGKGESWVVLSKINTVLYWSNIEFFALGGLMAFFSLKRPGVAKFLSKKSIQAAAILLSGGLLIGKYYWLNLSVLAIFFSLLVFHATQPGTMMSRLHHPLLIYLGKISYGMYIFHILVMITTAKLLHKLGILQGHNPSVRLIVLPRAFGLTMLAGALSYKWIESFFLRLKKRFTAVPSAPPDPQSL
jgi:peptidoglycan/LPS O-acetylase OafA/YrhL